MKFIDPRIDYAFKKIFGSEDAKDVLISFLESLLGLDGDRRIVELVILDPFLAPKIKGLKSSILDVKCRDQRGISYIVEMQVEKVAAMLKRIQYNAAKTYANQIARGEDYPKLNQVIAITITDFVLFDGFDHCVSRHEHRETLTGQTYLQEILYYFIELPKFKKTLEEVESLLDQWIWFIRYAGSLEIVPEKMSWPPIRHAFEKAMAANMTAEELEFYDNAGIAIADKRGAIEQALEDGRVKGIQEGIQKGMANVLLQMLRRRHADLPAQVEAQVRATDLETLQMWTDKALDGCGWSEIFRQSS
ncbi:MAG: Rpn family recombination-promoting nuclease/putative transposase [Magnetococcus sp. DMHC-1]